MYSSALSSTCLVYKRGVVVTRRSMKELGGLSPIQSFFAIYNSVDANTFEVALAGLFESFAFYLPVPGFDSSDDHVFCVPNVSFTGFPAT